MVACCQMLAHHDRTTPWRITSDENAERAHRQRRDCCAHHAPEVELVELARAEIRLELRTKHPESEHVKQQVHHAVRIVEKRVSDQLPDLPMHHRHRAKVAVIVGKFGHRGHRQPRQHHHQIHRHVDDDQCFHTAREWRKSKVRYGSTACHSSPLRHFPAPDSPPERCPCAPVSRRELRILHYPSSGAL